MRPIENSAGVTLSLSLRSGLVDLEWTIRRRRIGQQDLLLMGELISVEGHRGRSYVSHRLCEIWDWRQDNGRFRQIACRHLLRQLEGKGLVKLPPMLTSKANCTGPIRASRTSFAMG